ncbi:MAG TPA: methyltransferase domain-containing protein [Phycisphaerales bacterium]|nr:methyltransferase domain-containing protein [Phycisphaerales bacterium]HRQ75641.1 methyltransferase domain-containing protein [Phycisphaerales bacterium]
MTTCIEPTSSQAIAMSFVCPVDHAPLLEQGDSLQCATCRREFPIVGGVADFRDEAPRRWAEAQRYEMQFWKQDESTPQKREAMYRNGVRTITSRVQPHRPIEPSSRVLQIGTAGHAEIHYFDAAVKCAAEPLAVELSRHGMLVHGDVRWACTMGERLPFADGAFTHAVLANMIDHVAQPDAVLAEVWRCLEPGGVAYVTCNVSAAPLLPIFRALSGLRLGYFRGHLWFFTGRGLEERARRTGFEIASATTYRAPKRWQGWQGGLQRTLRPLLVSPHMMVLRKLEQTHAASPRGYTAQHG